MRWILKAVVIVVVAFTILSYVVYALDYQGNYNVTVENNVYCHTIQILGIVSIAITEVSVESQGTGVFDWLFSNGGNDDTPGLHYILRVTLESSEGTLVESTNFDLPISVLTPLSEPFPVPVKFNNIEPGAYTALIELILASTGTVIRSVSISMQVGA